VASSTCNLSMTTMSVSAPEPSRGQSLPFSMNYCADPSCLGLCERAVQPRDSGL
jgi:hypothetical protein